MADILGREVGPTHSPERCLWLAVLADQVNLACRERDTMGLKGDPEGAKRWIGSADFRVVCHLGGIDPAYVERKVREELAKPLRQRHLHNACIRSVSSCMTRGRSDAAEGGA